MIVYSHKTYFVRMDECDESECMIVMSRHLRPRLLWRLFGVKKKRVEFKYVGSGTVWHEFPSYKRCDTYKEMFLCEVWSREKSKWKKK